MDYQPIIAAVVVTAMIYLLPLVYRFHDLLRNKAAEFKASQDIKTQNFIDSAVSMAVRTAQQTLKENGAKREYAISLVQDYLTARGINLDVRFVADAVEAEVFSMKNW